MKITFAPAFFVISAALMAATPAMLHGQEGVTVGGPKSSASLIAESQLVTSIPGTLTGANIASIIGADVFYNAGYDGAGTITSNIEAGHIWNGHETLGHVTQRVGNPAPPFVTPAYDYHATQVGSIIGGRPTSPETASYQTGVAPGTDLRSGAIAREWISPVGVAPVSEFFPSVESMMTAYSSPIVGFGTAHVINSSWGAQGLPGSDFASATDAYTSRIESLANENRLTTLVVAAGNYGGVFDFQSGEPIPVQVSMPASGYNAISVGALMNDGDNNYEAVAWFSSGGPSDYRGGGVFVAAAEAQRPAVDIVAPGWAVTTAYYGGQSGGNDPSFPGSTDLPGTDLYATFGGTSAAAPIVAGSVALMHSAALDLNLGEDARDTRVIRSVLLNSARKIDGWDNGQIPHPNNNGGVITTQALDFYSGAGALDMARTFDNYLTGQTDIAGMTGGTTDQVLGWDYASVLLGESTDVLLTTPIAGMLNVTLTWFFDRVLNDGDPAGVTEIGYANLDLQVWDSTFSTLIAESVSLYSETEHLSFILPDAGQYALRVLYPGNHFGSLAIQDYGLAWHGTAVPEPSSVLLAAMAGTGLLLRRRLSFPKKGAPG